MIISDLDFLLSEKLQKNGVYGGSHENTTFSISSSDGILRLNANNPSL